METELRESLGRIEPWHREEDAPTEMIISAFGEEGQGPDAMLGLQGESKQGGDKGQEALVMT